ncbi:MAG: hypothetical protein F6K26_14305 [Moorea sp. SIO2I5]|nr:hypothetical protein [Moorena sp. SIO2I5]
MSWHTSNALLGFPTAQPNKALLVLGFILQPNLRLLHCSLFPVPRSAVPFFDS